MILFINNKYTKWYFNIISIARARVSIPDRYTEKHHIIPKSLGGDNSKNNLVKLTAKEHFICHRLLPKMTVDADHKRKMIFAQNMMLSKNLKQQRHKVTSREYARIKEEFDKINHFNNKSWQQNNAKKMKGKSKSPEAIEKLKKSWTIERRKRSSESQKGKKNPRTPEWTEKIRLANLGKKRSPYSEARRLQISESRKGKPAPWHGQLIKCEYCHDTFDKGNFIRSHGENCPAKAGNLTYKQKVRNRKKKEKQVSILGVIYNSLTEASKSLNINLCTISYRVRSDSFIDYFYL